MIISPRNSNHNPDFIIHKSSEAYLTFSLLVCYKRMKNSIQNVNQITWNTKSHFLCLQYIKINCNIRLSEEQFSGDNTSWFLAIKPKLAQYEKYDFSSLFFQISLWKSFCWGFFGNMLYIRFSAAQGSCLDTWPCLFKNNGLNLPGFPNMNQRSWWAFCLPNRLGFHQINLPLVLYRSDKSPQVQSMKD